jgi:O-antigen/teichoic acid export membrane protein
MTDTGAEGPALPIVRRSRAAGVTLLGSGGSVAVSVAQAVILIPLCLHHLGPRLYGAWLGSGELLAWVQLLDLGLPSLVIQQIGTAAGERDPSRAASWFALCAWALSLLAAVLLAIGLWVSAAVPGWVGLDGSEALVLRGCFRLGLVGSVLILLTTPFLTLAAGLQRVALVSTFVTGGAMVGMIVATVLLLTGHGLWALPIGTLARGAVGFLGGVLFLASLQRAEFPLSWRIARENARHAAAVVPATAAANLSYVWTHYSEVLLVASLLRPELATIYALTRKSAETLRTVIDTFALAVYGGFAHLLASADRWRARAVKGEILRLRFAVAVVAAACILALNEGLVKLLFGAHSWGGIALTLAFVVQLLVGGQSFLTNSLLRAAGAVRRGATLYVIEGILRFAAFAGSLLLGGMVAGPWASSLVTALFLAIGSYQLAKRLPESGHASPAQPLALAVPLGVVALGGALSVLAPPATWIAFAGRAAVLLALAVPALVAAEPAMRRRVGAAVPLLRRTRP